MSQLASSALAHACSPPQKKKHRFDVSGYPSPPSSGRTERHVDDNNVSNTIEGNKNQVDDINESTETIERRSGLTCSPEASQSPSPLAAICKEDDEQDEERGDGGGDDNDDDTIVAMSRSRSSSSWTNGSVSSPSTSLAAQSQIQYQPHQSDDESGSPYLDEELPLAPIRDTPRNPFLQGGPADVGFTGVDGHRKRMQHISIPRERGKMTYVFRGQRVTYADPYASDSDEEDGIGPSSRISMMDRFQPKLLFPSVGKAAVRSQISDVFGTVKKARTSMMMKSKPPTLDMTMERQSVEIVMRDQSRITSRSLLEKLDRAGWSDGDDDDDDSIHTRFQDEHDGNERGDGFQEKDDDAPRRCLIARGIVGDSCDDDDNDDDSDMEAEEENPFLEPACNQANASFLQRLQQTQTTCSQSSKTSGVVRPFHGAHRYKPYSQQPRGHAHGLAHAMHVPDHLKGRVR